MKIISLALASLLLAAVSIGATAANSKPLLPLRVTHAITKRIAHGEYPAMVVAVVDGGRSQVYGFGKLVKGKAPDGDTVFQIGSVTKTFTATLLADAVGRGQVTLDTPVTKLLAGFTIPTRDGKPITLGELAEQVSGLPRMPGNFQPRNPRDPYVDYGAIKLKAFLAGYSLTRDPGGKYEYSNLGFGLLGHALAENAGTTYADLVQARILQPLGMASSSATFTTPLGPRWAKGHDQTGKPAPPWHLGVLAGAGAINSTGADMLRYLKASMGRTDGPLQPAMHLAQRPRRKVGGDERIGLAWMIRHDQHGDVIWHNGMTGGYASFMGFTTDGKRGVVMLTNIARPLNDIGFATLLADAPLAPSTKPVAMSSQHQPVKLGVATLQQYVGLYQLAPGARITITLEDRQLHAQLTGQSAFPVYSSAKDEFYYTVVDAQLSFKRNAAGKVDALVLHQNGRDQSAPRVQ